HPGWLRGTISLSPQRAAADAADQDYAARTLHEHAMLRILGSRKTLCDGLTRRDMLWAGGLSMFGLGLSDYFRLNELQAAPSSRDVPRSFGKAKACILLYLYGSPSQLELA